MRTDYSFIGVMLVTAFLLMGVAVLAASFLRPKKPNQAKLETYECGMETVGDAWVQFRVQYYIFALVFVLFDVGGVLFFPLAAAFNVLPFYAVVIAILFLLTMLGALVYAWRKGALQWN